MKTLVNTPREGIWPLWALRNSVIGALDTCPWKPTALCGGLPEVVGWVCQIRGITYLEWGVAEAQIVVWDGGCDSMLLRNKRDGALLFGYDKQHTTTMSLCL